LDEPTILAVNTTTSSPWALRLGLACLGLVIVTSGALFLNTGRRTQSAETVRTHRSAGKTIAQEELPDYSPRDNGDTSGFEVFGRQITPWKDKASLEEIKTAWDGVGVKIIERIDQALASPRKLPFDKMLTMLWTKAALLNSEGQPRKAYAVYEQVRHAIEHDEVWKRKSLYNVNFYQGVAALRMGETENCVMCRGESSCILPISSAAVHIHPEGSRLAIKHFTDYLDAFPEDLAVRWLLNVAHMTLGEHPHKVDPRFLISLDHFANTELNIGKFRDIGHLVGVNQLNQSGGAIMEDFNNDGHLDVVFTAIDASVNMTMLRNTGHGTFEDITARSGLVGQYGGLNCVQTDYNNDGLMDIFVIRGAWIPIPIRSSLLRQNTDGTFTDVTEEAGLLFPVNSIAASWADYDNDGWLDLFVCSERQTSLLFHNLGNGQFEEVSAHAGVNGLSTDACKGAAWIDFDNDGYPDLFKNYLSTKQAQLFHNQKDGTFRDVSAEQGIDGPIQGFACWAWDYDNDGWTDIFATCYDRTLGDVIKGLQGLPHERSSNRLFRNLGGTGFQDVTKEAGLDLVFATMGSNFGDFDNDGYLDMYLGTGDPNLATLVPNRMFKNVDGKRFSEVTGTSGTGNLQKGHGVACGDWDRDGNVDILIQMGGPVKGDKYHNILFQNPGHNHNWLTVKLTGQKSNRPAVGAQIKVVTGGESPKAFYRRVTSGGSFGSSPLQQTIGIGTADRIAELEIYWPTSGTTQRFQNVEVNQAITITEFADEYQKLDWQPVSIPTEPHSASSMGRADTPSESTTITQGQ